MADLGGRVSHASPSLSAIETSAASQHPPQYLPCPTCLAALVLNVPRKARASLTQNLVSGSKCLRVEAESREGIERPVPDERMYMAGKSMYLHMVSWKEVPRNPRATPEGEQ